MPKQKTKLRQERCIIAAVDSNGAPSFVTVTVNIDDVGYEEGLHYELAKAWAEDNSYEKPMLVFDEADWEDAYGFLRGVLDSTPKERDDQVGPSSNPHNPRAERATHVQ